MSRARLHACLAIVETPDMCENSRFAMEIGFCEFHKFTEPHTKTCFYEYRQINKLYGTLQRLHGKCSVLLGQLSASRGNRTSKIQATQGR